MIGYNVGAGPWATVEKSDWNRSAIKWKLAVGNAQHFLLDLRSYSVTYRGLNPSAICVYVLFTVYLYIH